MSDRQYCKHDITLGTCIACFEIAIKALKEIFNSDESWESEIARKALKEIDSCVD